MSTKKIRLLLVSLLILAALSVTAYLAVDKIKTNEENQQLQENLSLHLFSFDSNAVTAVEIQNTDGRFRIETVDSSWAVTDTDYPYDFELNAYYINSICSYMSNLTAIKKLSVAQGDLTNYGLDAPVSVTCYDQTGTACTLYIGNASATQEYYYVMLPDDETVYEIEFNKGDVLHGGMAYLKDSYMLSCYDVNIQEFQLKKRDSTVFHFLREDTTWEMLAPLEQAQVNAANINSFLTSLVRLEIENFVTMVETGAELTEYHLKDPAYQFVIRTYDGETTTIDFAEADEDDASVYLVYEETGQIATMSVSSLGFLNTQPAELMSDKVYEPDFEQVTQLEVQVDAVHFTMSMDHAAQRYMLDETEISGLGEENIALFQSLFKTVSNISYESLDMEAIPAGDADEETDGQTETDEEEEKKENKNKEKNKDADAEPVLFRYTFTDGTQQELKLVPIDETYYQAYLNDSYTHKIVRRRALSGSTGVLTYYERMTDALAEAGITTSNNPDVPENTGDTEENQS